MFKGKLIFVYVEMDNEDVGKPVSEYFGITGDAPKKKELSCGFHLFCSTMSINCSKQLWENMQSSIAHLNQSSISEIESFVEENISTNHSTIEEFACATSSMHAEFSMRACDLVAAVNDSLLLDQETKKEIEYQSTLCLDELRSIQDNHGKSILDLRNQTEQCLGKSYMMPLLNKQTGIKCFEIAICGLSSALAGFEIDEKTLDKMLSSIEEYTRSVVEGKERDEAGRVLIRMEDRFSTLFSHDSDSMPRVWIGKEDIRAITNTAPLTVLEENPHVSSYKTHCKH